MSQELSSKDLQTIQRAFERASGQGWGLALGFCSGLGLFLATAILLVRGGPDPGPHLGLLSMYFPGYSVSWLGAFVGFFYAFAIGYGTGRIIGGLYNWIAARL
jgi:hypothetical protein